MDEIYEGTESRGSQAEHNESSELQEGRVEWRAIDESPEASNEIRESEQGRFSRRRVVHVDPKNTISKEEYERLTWRNIMRRKSTIHSLV